jgi:hypothetical protein
VTGPTRSRRQPEEAEVGEPERTFCGNQFGNTFPLLAHDGVPLCVRPSEAAARSRRTGPYPAHRARADPSRSPKTGAERQ